METIAQEKVALRNQMREKLAALTEAEVRTKSAVIWERLAVLPAFTQATRLLIYVSTGKEADTHGLIQQLLAMGRQVCAPAFDAAERRYVACAVRNFHSDLTVGQFGILEPKPGIAELAARDPIDAALVPGLAFDERGNRLGRGMGYFDRLLPGIGGVKIALAYDFQILKEIPAEMHDAPVDFIVTEIRVVETKGNRP
jgi:5-formyltetrahydrofolate cyclo-ligase